MTSEQILAVKGVINAAIVAEPIVEGLIAAVVTLVNYRFADHPDVHAELQLLIAQATESLKQAELARDGLDPQ